MEVSILTSLIAAGSATGGILIKMAYDACVERIKFKREVLGKFVDERKRTYDEFLKIHKEQVAYQHRLHELTLLGRAGKEVNPQIIEEFPESPLRRLVLVLEEIRRIARTNEIIQISERMVAHHGSTAAALRFFLFEEGDAYGLPLFLASRLREDQELEFISAYRKDLGIGVPKGAKKNYPIIQRPWPVSDAEKILNSHLRHDLRLRKNDKQVNGKEEYTPKKLHEKDMEKVASPKLSAMTLNPVVEDEK
ncbi:hypothetical protein AB0M44_35495 [Streptosporangium subroseum]|uniref:hypothetical protein n=1 Tax=Streptosporangium subroseum TaxID=106412 RepID=UPI003415E655